jgi:glycosyltransferase involved in cell wall biosynthesis
MTTRIAIVSAGTDTRMGGVERFSASLESVLADDWEISRLSPQRPVPVNIARFGFKDVWQSRDATRLLRASACDIVISNGTLGWGSPKSLRRIHVFHGTSPSSAWLNRGLPRRERLRSGLAGGVAEWLAGLSATTVAVSASAAEEVQRLYHIRVDAVIENGVDTELFAPRDRREARGRLGLSNRQKIALFVGRAEPRKGSALALAAAKAAGFVLAVAGPRRVDGAIYLGLLKPDELSWAYSAADCVVFPTSYEACSFVVLEALACAVPLVSTPVGWTRELGARVEGYSELLVAPTLKDVVAGLQAVGDSNLEKLTLAGRELIVARNSLDSFRNSWRQIVAGLPRHGSGM